MESERLAKIKLKNGGTMEFYRDENKAVRVLRDGVEVVLPKATGMATSQLFSLIEPMVESIEEDDNE
jgi:hypothetical protein